MGISEIVLMAGFLFLFIMMGCSERGSEENDQMAPILPI
jgi:hypothetical protein